MVRKIVRWVVAESIAGPCPAMRLFHMIRRLGAKARGHRREDPIPFDERSPASREGHRVAAAALPEDLPMRACA
jgi:hypothetical protein